jgi:hypothetical protein
MKEQTKKQARNILVLIPHASTKRPREIKKAWLSKHQNEFLFSEKAETDRFTEKLYDFKKIIGNKELKFPISQVYLNICRNPNNLDKSAPIMINEKPVYIKNISQDFRKKLIKKYIFPFYKKIENTQKSLILEGHSTVSNHHSLGNSSLNYDIVISNTQIDKDLKNKEIFCPEYILKIYKEEIEKRMPELKVGINSVYTDINDILASKFGSSKLKEGKKCALIHQETDENLYITNNKPDMFKISKLRKVFADSLVETMRRMRQD